MCISCGNSGRKRELCLSQLDSSETEMFRGYQEREECRVPFGGSRAAAGQVALAARNKTGVFSVSTKASPKSVFFNKDKELRTYKATPSIYLSAC